MSGVVTGDMQSRLAADPWQMSAVRIKRIRPETPGVYTYDLAFDDVVLGEQYCFAPGQFNMLYVPGVGEAAISVAGQSADRRSLQHTVRSVGAVTGSMHSGGLGASLGLRGPFGSSWPIAEMTTPVGKRDLIIAAGGIGLAPLRSLVAYVAAHRDDFGSVRLLIGARSPQDVLYASEHADWLHRQIEVQVTVDRPDTEWKGHVGMITLLLERLPIPNPASTLVMTCGPEVMMRYVARAASGRGVPEQNIWVTLERNMNCAIGLCGHCQLGPSFICKDGPVLRFDRVKDWLRVRDL